MATTGGMWGPPAWAALSTTNVPAPGLLNPNPLGGKHCPRPILQIRCLRLSGLLAAEPGRGLVLSACKSASWPPLPGKGSPGPQRASTEEVLHLSYGLCA